MCRSQIPPLPKKRGQFQQRQQQQQPRNLNNLNEEDNQTIAPSLEEEEDEIEIIDAEPTIYITELMEDGNKNNLIGRDFKDIRNHDPSNTTPQGEIIIQTTLKNNSNLNWLADTGSPCIFIDNHLAEELIHNDKNMKLEDYNGYMKLKCFKNQDIPIIGQIQIELRSGSWTAKNYNILVVKHKSQNLMGRDILTKLRLTLTQQQATKGKKILNISENVIEQNTTKLIFKKPSPLHKTR